MKFKAKHTFFAMSLAFLAFSFSIYLRPLRFHDSKEKSDGITGGRLVWQKYNCQTCHQLYGLGGYLGPDLTNVFSEKGKGEKFIKAMVKAGTKQMPSFKLSESELNELIEFLRSVDASGNASPKTFKFDNIGMISSNEKN